jgi:hypothetical protein
VTKFLLCSQGYGDMTCMIQTVEKTARQLGLDVWTKRSVDKKRLPREPFCLKDSVMNYFFSFLRFISKLNEEKSPALPEASTSKI